MLETPSLYTVSNHKCIIESYLPVNIAPDLTIKAFTEGGSSVSLIDTNFLSTIDPSVTTPKQDLLWVSLVK